MCLFYPKEEAGPKQQAGVNAGGGVCVCMHHPLENSQGGELRRGRVCVFEHVLGEGSLVIFVAENGV